jgi:sugar phosphate isomerase/epimerase
MNSPSQVSIFTGIPSFGAPPRRWLLAALACWAASFTGPAARAQQVSAPPVVAPPIYGFCMEIHDAKKRELPEQAAMLRELGFDGVGYPLWLGDELEQNLAVLDAAGLPVYLMYAAASVAPDQPAYDPRLETAIRRLTGRPITVCITLRGLPPGDPRGIESAVKTLRRLGDVAAHAHLRISIYHHLNDWTESLLFALEVVRHVDHPQVGANFNLCHWLKTDGTRDHRVVLRQHADRIFAVTINGARIGADAWTEGLIQPLDRGDFDNPGLLALLAEIGYDGPVGLMCFGIQGDAREHLARSIRVWNTWFPDRRTPE